MPQLIHTSLWPTFRGIQPAKTNLRDSQQTSTSSNSNVGRLTAMDDLPTELKLIILDHTARVSLTDLLALASTNRTFNTLYTNPPTALNLLRTTLLARPDAILHIFYGAAPPSGAIQTEMVLYATKFSRTFSAKSSALESQRKATNWEDVNPALDPPHPLHDLSFLRHVLQLASILDQTSAHLSVLLSTAEKELPQMVWHRLLRDRFRSCGHLNLVWAPGPTKPLGRAYADCGLFWELRRVEAGYVQAMSWGTMEEYFRIFREAEGKLAEVWEVWDEVAWETDEEWEEDEWDSDE